MPCMKYLSLRTSRDFSGPQDPQYLEALIFTISVQTPLSHKNQHSCSKQISTLVTDLVSMSIICHVSDSAGTSVWRTLNSSKFKDAIGAHFVRSIARLEITVQQCK